MTNEEAIRILPDMKGAGSEWDKAIDLAIDALKVQLSKEDATSGCISRQAALELGDNLRDDLPDDEQIAAAVMAHNEGIIEYQTKLSLLPSVQPVDKDINVSCKDAISRQAAIDMCRKPRMRNADCSDFEMEIMMLPSIQPDKDMIHLQKEQAYMQGWEEGRKALREEIWENERDRLD